MPFQEILDYQVLAETGNPRSETILVCSLIFRNFRFRVIRIPFEGNKALPPTLWFI